MLMRNLLLAAVAVLPMVATAAVAPLENTGRAPGTIAVLNALDKLTARVSRLEAPLDTPVRFEALEITVRACAATPPEEAPESTAFLELREFKPGAEPSTVFTGWMFASSPAASAMEHPIYDVWVIACKISAPVNPDGKAEKSAVPATADDNNAR